MTTLKLPNVSLVCLSGIGYEQQKNAEAIIRSCDGIEWGDVKYIQLDKIKDIVSWNEAVIFDLPKYVETSHVMFIHGDGWVTNPDLWNPNWLNLDFIGSPWPLPSDNYSYLDESGELQRVGNSVSLRSKKLLDLIATRPMEFHFGNNNEDGQICCWNRKWLESQGCKFGTFEQALDFGKEIELPEHKGRRTFCFHTPG